MSKTPKKQNKDIIKTKIKCMVKNGRREITTKEELEEFDVGSLISYMNNDNIFRPGGFLLQVSDEYFIYITPDLTKKFRVRFANVSKMWVGSPFQVTNDIVSIVESSQKKTNFPVKIGDVIVYYAQKKFDKMRYGSTDKYERCVKWYKYFIDPDFNDEDD